MKFLAQPLIGQRETARHPARAAQHHRGPAAPNQAVRQRGGQRRPPEERRVHASARLGYLVWQQADQASGIELTVNRTHAARTGRMHAGAESLAGPAQNPFQRLDPGRIVEGDEPGVPQCKAEELPVAEMGHEHQHAPRLQARIQ